MTTPENDLPSGHPNWLVADMVQYSRVDWASNKGDYVTYVPKNGVLTISPWSQYFSIALFLTKPI